MEESLEEPASCTNIDYAFSSFISEYMEAWRAEAKVSPLAKSAKALNLTPTAPKFFFPVLEVWHRALDRSPELRRVMRLV